MANIVKKVIGDMKADDAAQHEIDKANFKAIRANPNPDFEEFKAAEEITGEIGVVLQHAERNSVSQGTGSIFLRKSPPLNP